jgi:uncharacterized protein (TIGR03089 family)
MPALTFSALLDAQTRPTADPGRPLVTWYGAEPGERVELSVTSWANWVAKTASLLQEELDLGRGDRVLLDLPSHWLAPVWVGACWALGAVAVAPDAAHHAPDLVVCGPDGLADHAGGEVPVVATSLNALGTRFADPLPAGVVDLGEVVWAQPDAFTAWDPPGPDDHAWEDAEGLLTQAEVVGLRAAAVDGPLRVATARPPVSRDGVARFVHALASGGGTVWVADAGPARLAEVAATERAVVDPGQPA